MIIRSFFSVLMLLPVQSISASDHGLGESIRSQVHDHVTQELKQVYPTTDFTENVNIEVGNLDARLRLPACNGSLEPRIHSPKPYGSNLTVRVSCLGDQRWSVFVPVRLDIHVMAVVASRAIGRGERITEADVHLARVNTSSDYVEDSERVIGMTARRTLRAGEVVKPTWMEAPVAVERGAAVALEAVRGGITVTAVGTAMANGHVGDQIKVRNNQSNRVVDGRVIAPGKVQILF